MFRMLKKKNISCLCFYSKRKKEVIFLMIPNGEGWHPAIEKLSALSRGVASKNNGDFNCLSCLQSFRRKKQGRTKKPQKAYCIICIKI